MGEASASEVVSPCTHTDTHAHTVHTLAGGLHRVRGPGTAGERPPRGDAAWLVRVWPLGGCVRPWVGPGVGGPPVGVCLGLGGAVCALAVWVSGLSLGVSPPGVCSPCGCLAHPACRGSVHACPRARV